MVDETTQGVIRDEMLADGRTSKREEFLIQMKFDYRWKLCCEEDFPYLRR